MFKVTHSEKYVPDDSVTYYETKEEIKERYNVYSTVIDEELDGLKKGNSVYFMYDFYINLEVEYV